MKNKLENIKYEQDILDYGDVMTVDEFKDCCDCGGFIDYDGFGYLVKDGKMNDEIEICPSKRHLIPKSATHICWLNR